MKKWILRLKNCFILLHFCFFPNIINFQGQKKLFRDFTAFKKKKITVIFQKCRKIQYSDPRILAKIENFPNFFFAPFYDHSGITSRNCYIWIGPEGRYFLRRKLKKLKIHRKISLKMPNIVIFQRPVKYNLDKIEYSSQFYQVKLFFCGNFGHF